MQPRSRKLPFNLEFHHRNGRIHFLASGVTNGSANLKRILVRRKQGKNVKKKKKKREKGKGEEKWICLLFRDKRHRRGTRVIRKRRASSQAIRSGETVNTVAPKLIKSEKGNERKRMINIRSCDALMREYLLNV